MRDIDEPHRSLLLFLQDLWEQVELAKPQFADMDGSREVLEELQRRLEAMAVIVAAMAEAG